MYLMRFEGESVEKLSMQQLRGREGARVRRLYRQSSKRTGVPWDGREYDPENFDHGSLVNQALSAANSALYGVIHAVIVALGCSPGLGFVHTGTYRSFVYDIADLYKAGLSIPVAFDVALEAPEVGVGTEARRRMRDAIREHGVLEKAVRDIKALLAEGGVSPDEDEDLIVDDLHLWDDLVGTVEAGVAYADW
jgi:CRISPR-associated endonuclease cas1